VIKRDQWILQHVPIGMLAISEWNSHNVTNAPQYALHLNHLEYQTDLKNCMILQELGSDTHSSGRNIKFNIKLVSDRNSVILSPNGSQAHAEVDGLGEETGQSSEVSWSG